MPALIIIMKVLTALALGYRAYNIIKLYSGFVYNLKSVRTYKLSKGNKNHAKEIFGGIPQKE